MYRIYKAEAMDSKQQFLKANELEWLPTEFEFNSYDEAYVEKVNKQAVDNFNYYSIIKENR